MVELRLDLRGKIIAQNNFQAIKHGPIILSRDTPLAKIFLTKPQQSG